MIPPSDTTALVPVKGAGALSVPERKLLHEQEKIIANGIATFVGVGQALMVIREKRLYRLEFSSFEDYCRSKWGFSKNHANRYIAAQTVVKNLEDVDSTIVPRVESQIRPLTLLKPSEQKRVWKRVVEEIKQTGRPLTANIVTRTASDMYPDVEFYQQPGTPKRGDRVRLEKKFVLDELDRLYSEESESLKEKEPKEVVKWVKKVISAM